ncbi:uncharacterized protein LOC105200606 [Solenopsis invicta]|uniref:uncharacterized protein LOC105200606 n=1 Tax=Solenopsis invicta TaxID=13686 RepID=UPI000E33E472|nr:uncharacterized protein LOC105200606 [Solenopsis invicta]
METCLPSHQLFYSSLTREVVSESDYRHALDVCQRFNIRTIGEYSDLYLKTDVLLLADVFENFRETCLDSYGLDPAHYYTLPGYTWDAMLKYTGIRFELLTDIDMLLFVERGVRGGLIQCSNRYAKVNNRYAPIYEPNLPSTNLMYYDINNLYGWAMSEPLPYTDFKWIDVDRFKLESVTRESDVEYILEVDLGYPEEIHDSHKDLPFCPTREKPGRKVDKLLATLYDKERYVIHYRNLQQCLEHGMVLKKIYRILGFRQSTWLRGYIDLNTALRTRAVNDFERNLYKLMNNAVFGKTMENVRNRVDVRLLTRWDGRFGAEALISKPNFHSRSVFFKDLMTVELRRLEVKMYKPIYVGMCISDISKIRLYEFHYNYMLSTYADKSKLMYTDSLLYHVECDDIYENIKRDIARFDTSDYPRGNVYGMPRVNKKVPGLMKDENAGSIISEFVGLRAKMYALRVIGKNGTKKIKGVKKNLVAKCITFEDYVRCLNDTEEVTRDQTCIRSALHEVYTVQEISFKSI